MNEDKSDFWAHLESASDFGEQGDRHGLQGALRTAAASALRSNDDLTPRRIALVKELARIHDAPSPFNGAGFTPSPAEPGVSVVTCCRDRNQNLKRALSSWLYHDEIDEIVVVDWASASPVHDDLLQSGFDDARIQVVRVEDEPRWVLSFAFNLGFNRAARQKVLKADADILLSEDFFHQNNLTRGRFLAGDWRHAGSGQEYVNGFFYAWRDDLLAVGGFSEWITTYGWDDDELYARLGAQGVRRTAVAPGTVSHLDHDDAQRVSDAPKLAVDAPAAQTLAHDLRYSIQVNRQITHIMPEWTPSRRMASYETVARQDRLERVKRRPDSAAAVPDPVRREAQLAAAREMMSWRLGDQCYNLTLDQMAQLLETRPWEEMSQADLKKLGAPAVQTRKRKVFVDAQHGLGNRLRAIGSAAAIADASDRELVIVWAPDVHCEARFSDLFEYGGSVIEESRLETAREEGARVFNYMEIEAEAQKNEAIAFGPDDDVYLRSAYVLNHPSSTWERENEFLRRLRPVGRVLDLVGSIRSPNDLSVHVRMAGGPAFEHLPYESSENWTREGHEQVATWRKKSHYERFLKRVDALLKAKTVETLFLAADLPETYEMFEARYGDTVAWLHRPSNDRSTEQLVYALADAILLSRAPRLLGSTWSSFSELATRLSSAPMQVEMSGRDF